MVPPLRGRYHSMASFLVHVDWLTLCPGTSLSLSSVRHRPEFRLTNSYMYIPSSVFMYTGSHSRLLVRAHEVTTTSAPCAMLAPSTPMQLEFRSSILM